jgi:hypothetical protein
MLRYGYNKRINNMHPLDQRLYNHPELEGTLEELNPEVEVAIWNRPNNYTPIHTAANVEEARAYIEAQPDCGWLVGYSHDLDGEMVIELDMVYDEDEGKYVDA